MRGLNQIVDMNQKSKFALSFKFILQKIYFDADVIDFVAEMRHAIVHKDFPCAQNVLRLARVVFSWCFRHFWRPLLMNNLSKFSGTRLRMLSPYFFRGTVVDNEPLLRVFDRHRLHPADGPKPHSASLAVFYCDEQFGQSKAFASNLADMVRLDSAEVSGHLFKIDEMDEEDADQADAPESESAPCAGQNEVFGKLRICLNPASIDLRRAQAEGDKQPAKAEVLARRRSKWTNKSISGE